MEGKLLEPSWKGRKQNEVHRDREGRQQNAIGFRFLPQVGNQRIEHLYIYIYICHCRAFRLVFRLPTSPTN